MSLDNTAKAILAELQKDGSSTNAAIARTVGVSEETTVIKEKVGSIAGMERIETFMVLETHKRTYALPV